MKVLVVGAGGREHALCWKLAQSPQVDEVYAAPGNAGCAQVAKLVDIQPTQIDSLCSFVHAHRIDLTVVGPEVPLCLGLVDRIRKLGFQAFGPTREAAKLEGSKAFCKQLARQNNIPGPDFKVFDSSRAALDYLDRAGHYPLVIKADGLAEGKGVAVCADAEQAQAHIRACMDDSKFGDAGARILIEEFIKGTEASVQVITDGQTLVVLEPARDYKAAYDGGTGPNTGGMGCVSPSPIAAEVMRRVEEKILIPAIHGLARNGHPFSGLLYAGLMLTPTGPRLLEFNVRFGDPETQPTLRRLQSDLFPLLWAAAKGEGLEQVEVTWDPRPCVTAVLTSGGYPGSYRKGYEIRGIEAAEQDPEVVVFHAGTTIRAEKLVTSGGRVLNVTAVAETVAAAREKAYAAARQISFEGVVMRTDIGAEF